MPSALPPSSGYGFHALLKNRPFLALWTGQLISQIADKIFFVLLIALLNEKSYLPPPWFPITENAMRSTVMVAFTLPAILFGSAAGIFVDRFFKKQILIFCNIIRIFFLFALPVLPRDFVILLVITFAISTVTQFFAPAEQAAIPLTVPRQGLLSANAMFTASNMVGIIIGMAIGEPLLTLAKNNWGHASQELIVAAIYLISTVFLYDMRVKETVLDPATPAVHPWHDFKEGISYLKRNRLVSNALVQLTILYSVFAALTVLAINLAEKVGLKPTQFGFLLAAAGVGMVIGAGILGSMSDRLHHKPLPLVGFLTMAFVLGMFPFTTELWLGLMLSVFLGFGASLIAIPMQTLIQEETLESMRGKIFGFENNMINIALSLPLAIAGPLTDAIGLNAVLFITSFIVTAVGIGAWLNTRRVLRDLI